MEPPDRRGLERRWSDIDDDEIVELRLTAPERQLLWHGMHQWGGPSRGDDAIARVIGFDDMRHLYDETNRIWTALKADEPLSKRDWRRVLVAAEICWASSYYGASGDWDIVTPYSDVETLELLRGLQSSAFLGLRNPPQRGLRG